ncbi:hypothetical protein [Sagittula salina]|uniref:Uncharacterized protein n=1 Tax=Sagittula salina TaxID=2820268 RepID=A0A940MPI9_9RHOB|nr:hypothetical protein [Sagittula salina]MBP0482348.1 hypothetical protein [Sagittula salina]
MTQTVIVPCDHALACAPEWVTLLHIGRNDARDGRRFVLDKPQALPAAFDGGGIDLPVDYGHQNDRPEPKLSGMVAACSGVARVSASS